MGFFYHDKENQEREKLKTQLCEEKDIKLFHIWEDDEEIGTKEVFEYLDKILDK